MIAVHELTGPVAALAAGLVTSIHCAGMCGPLACSACARSHGGGGFGSALGYHAARIVSYALVGLAGGLVGRRLADALSGGATRWITWLFVLFFLAVVVGLDKKIRVPLPRSGMAWLAAASSRCGPRARAGVLGFFTPVLPCAPLYLVVVAAALSGSAWSGGAIMAAFALGTVPLLLLLQSQVLLFGSRWSPNTMDLLRRGLALASVVLLVMRGLSTTPGTCAMCH